MEAKKKKKPLISDKEKIRIYNAFLLSLANMFWDGKDNDEKIVINLEKLKAYSIARTLSCGNQQQDKKLQDESLKNLLDEQQKIDSGEGIFLENIER